jgi:hypothetical protein
MSSEHVRWPTQDDPLRDDEAALFAFCRVRWPHDPWAKHDAHEYADCTALLNDRFTKRFGWRYTDAALQRHVQHLRTEHRYQYHGRQKRYNHYSPLVKARLPEFTAIFDKPLPAKTDAHHEPELSWRETKKTLSAGDVGVKRMTVELDNATCGELVQNTGKQRQDKYAHSLLNTVLDATGACFVGGKDEVLEHIIGHMRVGSKVQRPLRSELVKKGIKKAKDAMQRQHTATSGLRFWSALQMVLSCFSHEFNGSESIHRKL